MTGVLSLGNENRKFPKIAETGDTITYAVSVDIANIFICNKVHKNRK